MFVLNGRRFNIHARYTDPETGEKGIDMTKPENRTRCGVTEVADPQPPEDFSHDLYTVQESDVAPYVEYIRRSDEEIARLRRDRIDREIDGKERNAMLPRVVREDLMLRFQKEAANLGITVEQLLDPLGEHYAPGYAKVHAFNAEIQALRAQR